MKEIIIEGTVDEELTSEEYNELFDILMMTFGFTNISIKEKE